MSAIYTNTTAENIHRQTAAPRRFCDGCGTIKTTSETVCPQCGKTLETVRRIRITGVLSVALGVVLFSVMSWLALWVYNSVAAKSPTGANFSGKAENIGFMIVVLGLVLTISLFSVIAGFWQLIFGTRSRILKYIAIGLGLAFIGMSLMDSIL